MTDLLTEAELAELHAIAGGPKLTLSDILDNNQFGICDAEGRIIVRPNAANATYDLERLVILANSAPRLIAAARLANEQAERCEYRIAERDATIEQQAERIAKLKQDVLAEEERCKLTGDALTAEAQVCELTVQLAERDATIEWLEGRIAEWEDLRERRLGDSDWLVTDAGRYDSPRPTGSAELRAEADAALVKELEESLKQ